MKHIREFLVLGFVSLLVFSCGGSASESSASQSTTFNPEDVPVARISKSGGASVAAVMGPAGGSLELADGARIEIPAGAIQKGEEIVFKNAHEDDCF
jgi:hypothetical protein